MARKWRGLDVPDAAKLREFKSLGDALQFAFQLEADGYVRPARGRHVQGLAKGKYVLFDHDHSYWVGWMVDPDRVVHVHRYETKKRHKFPPKSERIEFKLFKRGPANGPLAGARYYRCVDCGGFVLSTAIRRGGL